MRQQLRPAPRASRRHRRPARQILQRNLRLESASLRLTGRPLGHGRLGLCGEEIARIAINQRVPKIGALADGAQFETGGQFGGQILQTVNRQVGLMFQQRDFQFFGEKSLGQSLGFPGQGRPL